MRFKSTPLLSYTQNPLRIDLRTLCSLKTPLNSKTIFRKYKFSEGKRMRNREKLMEVTGSLGERDEARTAKDTVHQVNKRAFPRTRETHKEDSDDRRNIHIRLADSTGENCFGIQGGLQTTRRCFWKNTTF